MKMHNNLFISGIFRILIGTLGICAASTQAQAQQLSAAQATADMKLLAKMSFTEIRKLASTSDIWSLLSFCALNKTLIEKVPNLLFMAVSSLNNDNIHDTKEQLKQCGLPVDAIEIYHNETACSEQRSPEVKKLIKLITTSNLTTLLADLIVGVMATLAKAKNATSQTIDLLANNKDFLLCKLSPEKLEQIIAQTFNDKEIRALGAFIQTEVPERLLAAIADQPSGLVTIIRKFVEKYHSIIGAVSEKIKNLRAKAIPAA